MPTHRTLIKGAFIALAAAITFALPAHADGIEVHDAYARTAYPGAPTGAIFMVIYNHDGQDDRLISVETPAAARAELHTHIDAGDGVMQMRHVPEGFALPTNGAIVMQRGGNHVMLMGLTGPIEIGATVPLTLTFASGKEISLEVEAMTDDQVEALGIGGTVHDDMNHSSMDHSTMDHGSMDHGTDGHDSAESGAQDENLDQNN